MTFSGSLFSVPCSYSHKTPFTFPLKTNYKELLIICLLVCLPCRYECLWWIAWGKKSCWINKLIKYNKQIKMRKKKELCVIYPSIPSIWRYAWCGNRCSWNKCLLNRMMHLFKGWDHASRFEIPQQVAWFSTQDRQCGINKSTLKFDSISTWNIMYVDNGS